MDEIIVRLARAMASQPRLRIFALLVRQGELTPTQLVDELSIPINVISMHLRVLVTAGLISRRKSGARCYYRAESPYDSITVSGKLTAWLRNLWTVSPLPAGQHPGLHEVRDVASRLDQMLNRTLFEVATAFTDLRRLQILRYLGHQRCAGATELMEVLSMSSQALSRHMRKLSRRGYVLTHLVGHALVYELSPTTKTALHRRMLEIVRQTWEQVTSRTS